MELPRGRAGVWLDLVADLMATPLVRWPGAAVARALVETFDAAGCGFTSAAQDAATPPAERCWPMAHFVPHLEEVLRWSARDAAREHPLLRYHLATGDMRSMRIPDVPAEIADRRLVAAWNERGRHWGGVQAQLSLVVHHGPSDHRAFVVGRTDDFGDADIAAARTLQRLLAGLDRQIAVYGRWAERPGVAVGAVDAIGLTPRQLAVLDLLAHGHTAAAIGRRLGIAERTVQKHLQRVYAGLGVADRLCAVQRAQHIGLL